MQLAWPVYSDVAKEVFLHLSNGDKLLVTWFLEVDIPTASPMNNYNNSRIVEAIYK